LSTEIKRNIFLEDMCYEDDANKDLRGWHYEENCKCWKCQQFLDAAYWVVQKMETGKEPPRLEYTQVHDGWAPRIRS